MNLSVEIDPASGFCGGVIRAIGTAESFLDGNPGRKLYSLGAIVHNGQELSRLKSRGLHTVDNLDGGFPLEGEALLIRAHGEPPKTYAKAREMGLEIIDCTCPVVLKLQKDIREAHMKMSASGGRVVIFGTVGHAEVLGLVGQTSGEAVVVENLAMLESMIASGAIDTGSPVEVFSQTTKDPGEYAAICARLKECCSVEPVVHDTICRQVVSRHRGLVEFAGSHSIVIFVAGRTSSNGHVLSGLCRSVNPRTYVVSCPEEIDSSWFRDGDKVGVSGATSTPGWLLERVVDAVYRINKERIC